MSAADATCYPVTPEEENGAGEMKRFKTYGGSSVSNSIASEIVNEILESALDAVMQKQLKQNPKFEKISPNVVGDIIGNILSKSANSPNQPYFVDETVLLDEEMKQIIKEMKYPPDQKPPLSTKGVGDQLTNKDTLSDQILATPIKRNTLERKNRLTNLVRNSKQMLSKFMSEEKIANDDGEKEEKLVKVVEYEVVGDNLTFKVQTDSAREPERFDLVNLHEDETACGEGKEERIEEVKDKCEEDSHGEKKKWNIGARILKYFRKRSKRGGKIEPLPEEQ